MRQKEDTFQNIDFPVFRNKVTGNISWSKKLHWLLLILSVLFILGLLIIGFLSLRSSNLRNGVSGEIIVTPTQPVEKEEPVGTSSGELRDLWNSIRQQLEGIDFQQRGLVPPVVELDLGLDPEIL